MGIERLVFSEDVASDLVSYCRARSFRTVVTVSDSNTFTVLGDALNNALLNAHINTKSIILDGKELIADERAIMSVLLDIDPETQATIAIGSGTITDIVRFVSHRMCKAFVSIPTAPSVDGYSSSGAPLVLGGYKQSIPCHAPDVIFASLKVLASAPEEMIAAGFADVLGKITALADWELAHVLINADFDRQIAKDIREAYTETIDNVSQIARREPKAIRNLFRALTTTGESIARFGSSEPASGCEHHISHFLEMQHMANNEPPRLHGLKVAIGSVIVAGWYQMLRDMTRENVRNLPLAVPDYEDDASEIRRILGPTGNLVLESNSFLSTLTQNRVETIRARLIDNWDRVQEIARQVPQPARIQQMLDVIGGPHDPVALGLSREEVANATRLCHFVRSRFTIRTLLFVLGVSPAQCDLATYWSRGVVVVSPAPFRDL